MELDPQYAAAPANYGRFLMRKGNYPEAERQYKRAISLQPNNTKYLSRLSSAYYMQGKYDDALDVLDKSIDLLSGTPSALGNRSLIQRRIGKAEEALKDAEQAYGLDSSVEIVQIALGAAYLDHGRYDEAIKLLPQVKDNATARILEATAHAKQGNTKKAADIYSAIPEWKLSPKHVPRWGDRAVLLSTLKPYVASKLERAGTLQAQGKYREALNELGDAMRIAGDAETEILTAMSGIIRTDPRLSALPEEAMKFALRGDVMTEEGDFKEAAEQYRRAVNTAPYIARLHFNIAIVYGEMKKYPRAVRSMQTYLLLAPEAPNARSVKNQIYKWEFKMERGE